MSLRLLLLFIGVSASHAWAGPLRITASLGFGATTSSNEASESEGPLVQIYAVDYALDSRSMIGFEHYRALGLSPMSTSTAFTGLNYKWYFNNVPGGYTDVNSLPVNSLQVRDRAVYAGLGFGIGQSSFPPELDGKTPNAAGLYLNPKIGLDLPLNKKIGFHSELNFITTIMATGSLTSFSVAAGIYYLF